MNKKLLKQIFLVFALMTGAIALVTILPSAMGAELINPADNLVGPDTAGEGSIRVLIVRMVNYFLGFLGLLAVIMVIYGGVTYVTSAGEDEKIQNAKKIIMYALIGLIIILLSFVIVKAIVSAGTGVEQ
jgi:type IV secretion system pilin